MRPQELNKLSVMDPDPVADTEPEHGAGLEACGGAGPEETRGVREREGLLNTKGGDRKFSSASSSSNSSSTLPSPPVCVEEEKDLLSGCSKSFTGLKLFGRR